MSDGCTLERWRKMLMLEIKKEEEKCKCLNEDDGKMHHKH